MELRPILWIPIARVPPGHELPPGRLDGAASVSSVISPCNEKSRVEKNRGGDIEGSDGDQ